MDMTTSLRELESIFKVVLAFNSTDDRKTLLDTILTNMMEITRADAGTLYTLQRDQLQFKIIRNQSLGIFESYEEGDENALPPIILDENNIQNISAYAAIKNEVVLVNDVYNDQRFNFSGTKKYDELTGYNTKSMFVFPICARREDGDEVLGVLQLINPINPDTGEIGDFKNLGSRSLVLALTNISANTLANLTHVTELQSFLSSFAAALTQAIDERSRYNGSHTQNVAQYCEHFAMYLGEMFQDGHPLHFNSFHVEAITFAAFVHDIGKIITPLEVMDKSNRLSDKLDEIRYRFGLKQLQLQIEHLQGKLTLEEQQAEAERCNNVQHFIEQINAANFLTPDQLEKIQELSHVTYVDVTGQVANLLDKEDIDALSIQRGTLTHQERKIMEEHVAITSRLLDKIPFRKYYADVPLWAGAHHEFLDGTGYPNKLKGDQIPMETRIITIMDIFDALIDTRRPYKNGVPIDKALSILREMVKEGKLDEQLVELFAESKLWEKLERF